MAAEEKKTKKKKSDGDSGPEKESTKQESSNAGTSSGHFKSKRIYRSNTDKMLGGVCGGLAEYFELDPTLVRILAVCGLIFGGFAFPAYIIAWIIIPESDVYQESSSSGSTTFSRSGNSSPMMGLIGGGLLLFFGMSMLFDNFDMFHYFPRWMRSFYSFETFFGMFLIGIGCYIVYNMMNKKAENVDPVTGEAQPKDENVTGDTSNKNYANFDSSRTLYRSRTDRKMSGVCGGIGEYFAIDPTLVRIAWVVGSIFSGGFPGVILYIVMAVIVPETPILREESA